MYGCFNQRCMGLSSFDVRVFKNVRMFKKSGVWVFQISGVRVLTLCVCVKPVFV